MCRGCMAKNGVKPEDIEVPDKDLIFPEDAISMVGDRDQHCCDRCGEGLLTNPEGMHFFKVADEEF